jgi:hypothetical protein
MGILVQGNFTSPEGFTYSSFYLKITGVSFMFNVTSSTDVLVRINVSKYLSRELSKSNMLTLNIKSIQPMYTFTLPFNKIDLIPIVSYMYYLISAKVLSTQTTQIQYEPILEQSQILYQPPSDLISIAGSYNEPTRNPFILSTNR